MKNRLIEFCFENQSDKEVLIWTEPAAYEITIPPQFEYKMITDDHKFRLEFDNEQIIFYLETSFGYKLMKRKLSLEEAWEIEIDTFDIQLER